MIIHTLRVQCTQCVMMRSGQLACRSDSLHSLCWEHSEFSLLSILNAYLIVVKTIVTLYVTEHEKLLLLYNCTLATYHPFSILPSFSFFPGSRSQHSVLYFSEIFMITSICKWEYKICLSVSDVTNNFT